MMLMDHRSFALIQKNELADILYQQIINYSKFH